MYYIDVTGETRRVAVISMPNGIHTLPGRSYLLEGSADLRTWSGLDHRTASDYRLDFEIPDSVDYSRQFYRAAQAPP